VGVEHFVVCDNCKRKDLDPPAGWLKIEAYGIDVRTFGDDMQERHFCGWACLSEFASRKIFG